MNSFEMNYQSISFSLDLCMIIVIIRNISRNWKIVEKKKEILFYDLFISEISRKCNDLKL